MRNNNLDILKISMAFLVVALHIFPVSKVEGVAGLISYEIASGITRIAVPTFFLISGFFLRHKLEDSAYLGAYMQRLLSIYLVWQLLYLPDVLHYYHLGWFNKKALLLKMLYGYWHLWYLLATVMAVGLLYWTRHWAVKAKFGMSFLLLAVGYAFQIVVQSGVCNAFPKVLTFYENMGTTRNFLFFGYPMLLLGTLYEHWNTVVEKIKHLYFPLWVILLVEVAWYFKHQVKAMDFLLVLPLLSMMTFHCVKTAPNMFQGKINGTLSLGIYLCHPYAIRVVDAFLPEKGFYDWLLKYPLICLLAIAFWWLVEQLNKRLPYFY